MTRGDLADMREAGFIRMEFVMRIGNKDEAGASPVMACMHISAGVGGSISMDILYSW